MPQPYYLLFHRTSIAAELEWATKYHVSDNVHVSGRPESLAAAESELVSDDVTYWRWEFWDDTGHKAAESQFIQPLIGDLTGDTMPIKYAILLRCNSATLTGRPSSRYIHGFVEGHVDNGTFNAAGFTALDAYNSAMSALAWYRDSDGNSINSHSFRSFTRRKRVRRLV